MSENQLDSVVFGLDADTGPYKAKLASIEAQTDVTAARIRTKTATFFSDTSQGQAKLAALSAALGQTATAAEGTGAKFTNLFQTMAAGIPALGGVSTAVKDVAGAVDKSHVSVNMATREFRALFDELSSGRTRMVPGTLAIIATRVLGISGATLAWGAGLLAIPIAFGVAAYAAENALGRIDSALKRTGNAAGATHGQLLDMARQLDKTTALSERGALDALAIMLSHGNVPVQLAQRSVEAVPGFARLTDQSQDKATTALEKLFSDPAKGAKELSEQFKLLDPVTVKEIEHLQASGDRLQAMSTLIDAFNHRMEDTNGILAGFGKAASDFWSGMGTFFTGHNISDATRLEGLQAERAGIAAHGLPGGRGGAAAQQAALVNLDQQIDKLKTTITAANDSANKARDKATANEAIGLGLADVEKTDKFKQHLKELQEEFNRDTWAVNEAKKSHSQLTDELVRQQKAVGLAIANQRTPAQIAAEEASDAIAVSRLPEAQQQRARDQFAARRERERLSSDPLTALDAEGVYQSRMSVAGLKSDIRDANKESQNLANMRAEASAQISLAEAYGQGNVAADKARALGEANVAVTRKEISDAGDYTKALLLKAAAQDAVNVAQAAAAQKEREAGAARILAAGGQPLAVQAATIENQARAATQPARDSAQAAFESATTPAAKVDAQKLIDENEKNYNIQVKSLTAQAQSNALAAADQEDVKIANENKLLALKISLYGQDQSYRDKAMSDAQAAIDLTEKGIDVTTKEGKIALANLEAQLEKKRQLTEQDKQLQQEQTKFVDLENQGIDALSGIFDKVNSGHASIKGILTDLGQRAAKMVEELGVINPLKNMATKAATGQEGTLPTFAKMFAAKGTPTNPMYVAQVDGIMGGANDNSPSSLSSMGDKLLSMFGGSGGASPASASTNASSQAISAAEQAAATYAATSAASSAAGASAASAGGGAAASAGAGSFFTTLISYVASLFGQGGAWSGGGVRYAASGMVLGGPTMFHTGSGPVIGGELGANSEALMPLARGPDGNLGVRASGARGGSNVFNINVQNNIHPDVSAVARAEIGNQMPTIRANVMQGVQQALNRNVMKNAR